MATTEGSLRSASLNGFKIADPLVIDAKYDPTLMERREKQSFSTFLPCVLLKTPSPVDKGKSCKKSAVYCDFYAFLVVDR